MGDLDPQDAIASFDSATMLHHATAAALHGKAFSHLGNSALLGTVMRIGGRLPWPVLRRIYTRAGATEGIAPNRLGDVDMAAVARWLTDDYPLRRYPAVLIGSSNGALTHLAAALNTPWLPGTTFVPVARSGDPHRPVDALRFGHRVAGPFLERNEDVTLHQMHDPVQDELMSGAKAYFRAKWHALPEAYAQFLTDALAPGAPVVVVEDRSSWPVVRLGERHVFQTGGRGGIPPSAYLSKPHTPEPDEEAPEAEWGADPGLTTALEQWCHAHGHPLIRLSYPGPQAPAHAVATVLRDWYRRRGEPAERLVTPSFLLGDPWRTITSAAVPFWTFFSVQPALEALDAHLAASPPYRDVHLMLFQHGVWSEGIATPQQWAKTIRAHGATPHFTGLDPSRFPRDIGTLGRYGPALAKLPSASHPSSPLDVDKALTGLQAADEQNIEIRQIQVPPSV